MPAGFVLPAAKHLAALAEASGAVVAGGLAAVGLMLGGGVVLGATWAGVRGMVGRADSARWAREWERVGPEWSRSVR